MADGPFPMTRTTAMLILLIRHAQAAEQSDAEYPDDALRPLVPKGRKVQRRMSRLLVKQDCVPTRVFSSPWKRAWQTARIVVEETGIGTKNRIRCDALAEPLDLAALAREIGEIGHLHSFFAWLLLVG